MAGCPPPSAAPVPDFRHRRRWQWRIGAVAWLALIAAGCGGDEESRPTATLVYEEFSNNTVGRISRIVRVAADGSHRRVLWEGTPNISSLYPSPDGRSILFLNYDSGQWFLLPAAGGMPAPIAAPGSGASYPTFPVWAPDGSAIAWVMVNPDNLFVRRLGVAPPGSGTATLVSPDSLDVAWVDWSPDSQQLVICTRSVDGELLYVLGADGANLRAIASGTPVSCRQAWAPASRIAFPGGGLYTIDADGTNPQRIALRPPGDGINFTGPVYWSPTGLYLAVTDDVNLLWRVEVNGGANSFLRVRAAASNPWSPDGSLLLFLSDSTKVIDGVPFQRNTISVMRGDGTEPRTVSPDSVDSYAPAWLHDPS
jgi:Tol biopolymer transport system component